MNYTKLNRLSDIIESCLFSISQLAVPVEFELEEGVVPVPVLAGGLYACPKNRNLNDKINTNWETPTKPNNKYLVFPSYFLSSAA